MSVLFLSTWFPYPPDNGSKLRVYHLLRALTRQYQVTVISFAFATARPDAQNEMNNWCQEVRFIRVNPYMTNRAGILRTFLSFKPIASRPIGAMSRSVEEALRSQAFDVVIASTGMMADYALRASPDATKILEEHNSLTRWMEDRYEKQTSVIQRLRCWVSWQKTRYYEARLFSRFDLVTMVSGQDHATTHGLPSYHGRSAIVPNGVDCTYNHLDLGQLQLNHLIFNGSLTYSANYEAIQWFLAKVWAQICAHFSDAKLTITGSTVGVDLNGLTLNESVHFTGYVEDVRIPVAQAAIAIAPIRQGGGTRLKILEAMALGTPVVATSKGAEGLDVVDGEHLLLADTPDAFAVAVVRLLGDANLSHQLSVNARRLVEERYDWESIGQRFVSLVEETVERKRGMR